MVKIKTVVTILKILTNFIVHRNFSLTYKIKSENVYENFLKCKDLFDFSKYSKDSIFFDRTNKKLLVK